MAAGKLPLAVIFLNEDWSSSVDFKRSCFPKKMSSRKAVLCKNQWAAGGQRDTCKTRNSTTEGSSLPCHHYMQKISIQICSCAGAGNRAGEGRQRWGRRNQHIPSGLSPCLCNSLSVPCCTVLVSPSQENKLDILHLILTPAFVTAIYWSYM